MADTYLTFATRGMHVEPRTIVKVTDASGRVLWEPRKVTGRALEEHEADVISHVLQQVVQRGTGTRARLRTPVAGKTGTTQSYGDAWFVGYTPGMSTAVWMGFPEGQDHEMRNVHGIKVTGGSLPAQIWHAYMEVATQDPRYRGEFVDPGDLGGQLIPSSGRIAEGEEESTTTTTATTVPEESTTTSSAPDDGSTTSTTAEEETTTTSTSEPATSTTTTTTLPTG
jgi:membrane peptidoglycan carboxypeptidase